MPPPAPVTTAVLSLKFHMALQTPVTGLVDKLRRDT